MRLARGALLLHRALLLQPLEFDRGVIGVAHRIGDGTVPGDIFLINATEAERDGLVSAVLSGASRTKQLERMRFAAEHGYSAYEAEGAGLTGIAVPVWAGNEICAALALSGPSTRFSVKNAESWLADMRIAAKRLEPWMDAD